ncbi:hypothetical protein K474DRAFT_1677636 [Panus rudis PR-1116 ss-1]|nr:hypothetical protein K474DRAFT_1677636 [Panus rudis PR-1116 ss-1]
MIFFAVLWLPHICSTIAQDLTVPPLWRVAYLVFIHEKPSSNRTRQDRITLAEAVGHSLSYSEATGQVNGLFHTQSTNWHCALALYDWITGGDEFEQIVRSHIPTVFALHAKTSSNFTNDPINLGLAAYYAYRAYNDTSFLDMAKNLSNQALANFITPENAASGNHPTKNVTFASECSGASTAGGVFYVINVQTDTHVSGASAGLAAHLFDATRDTQYSDAAELTAAFMTNHMYNGGIISDIFDPRDCSFTPAVITDNSGFYIEGLSVLANSTANSTWMNNLKTVISTTIKASWTDSSGIVNEGLGSMTSENSNVWPLKGLFIRGLYEAWSRFSPDSDVAKLIQSYLLVQFNAILDFAKSPDGDIYSPNWHDSPATKLLPWGQLAAIDVLNSAINLPILSESTSPSTIGSVSPESTSTDKNSNSGNGNGNSSNSNTPTIVGAVVGSIGGILLLLLITALKSE